MIQPFEEKHNVKVNLKEYEGTGAALAIVEQSQPGDWDVFVIDGVDVPNVVSSGLLAPLPQDQLPLDDVFKAVQMRDMTFADGKMYAIMEKFGIQRDQLQQRTKLILLICEICQRCGPKNTEAA